jgi:CrcB protein
VFRRPDVLAAIFVGGCLGGAARYASVRAWPTPAGRFPWSTLMVNLGGALVLAVVLVAAAQAISSRYLRPLLGTGFCGAFTTFSSVVVDTDRLLAHGGALTAAAYLGASVAGGVAAAALGLVIGRAGTGALRATAEGGP